MVEARCQYRDWPDAEQLVDVRGDFGAHVLPAALFEHEQSGFGGAHC